MTAAGFSIEPAGDAALTVHFPAAGIDLAAHARVTHTATAVTRQAIPGLRDVVPAVHSLAIHFDPLRTDLERLVAAVSEAASTVVDPAAVPDVVHDIPVCYGGTWGPDLDEVAKAAQVPAALVIRLHSQTVYRVLSMGFTPGFAYLGPVDARIAISRRATPRLRVPAGSVGIAGLQTGVYPSETPGGWRIVGRTPFRPFVPRHADPFRLKPGEGVRFVAIDDAEYRRLDGEREEVDRDREEEAGR